MSTEFDKAKQYIPGGVNSPVRSFKAVHEDPIFIDRAKGAYLYDKNSQRYIDYILSWGPMILGHAHPEVIEQVSETLQNGTGFGTVTELETQFAQLICEMIPSVEKVRLTSSGTEASMSAIRLARGYTKRDKIIKFEGCYHGHVDSLLAKAGSGILTFSLPDTPGIPEAVSKDTIVLAYNDMQAIQQAFEENKDSIAAVIIEPIAGNMNLVPAHKEFLKMLKQLCAEHQAVLIFDEVMSGFRVTLTGAQGFYNMTPDLSIFGKVIGGGMPIAAVGGKAEIMDCFAPLGNVYQAGTLSGNPVAVSAGMKTLEILKHNPQYYTQMDENAQKLNQEMMNLANQYSIPFQARNRGSMLGWFFSDQEQINNLSDVSKCNQQHFVEFFSAMLKQFVYIAPSSFEAGFLSISHTQKVIDNTLEAVENSFKLLSKKN